jgi:hypothetical protein
MSLAQRIFTERRSILIPVLALWGVCALLLAAMFWLQQSVEGAEEARVQAASAVINARRQETDAKAQVASKDRADVELKKFYTEVLPKDFLGAVNTANFWLGRIAENARLRYRSGAYDSEQVRDSGLTRVTGEVTLLGEYADIRRFLYEVETAQEFVIIEKVALSQPSLTQGNAQLEVALSIATYFLTDGQPAEVSR